MASRKTRAKKIQAELEINPAAVSRSRKLRTRIRPDLERNPVNVSRKHPKPKAARAVKVRERDTIPTWVVVSVVIIGGVAVSFPLSLANFIFGWGIGSPPAGLTPKGAFTLPPVICKDSGSSLSSAGSCSDREGALQDRCLDSDRVIEYSCGANMCAASAYSCSGAGFTRCEAGKCV